jgi:hypothetical protein
LKIDAAYLIEVKNKCYKFVNWSTDINCDTVGVAAEHPSAVELVYRHWVAHSVSEQRVSENTVSNVQGRNSAKGSGTHPDTFSVGIFDPIA